MALLKKTQRSFAGGLIDKDLTGRQDLAKYAQGCLELTNFKVRKQGNLIKRSGTDLVADFTAILGTGTAVADAKILPLVQERENGLYILITAGKAFLVSPEGVKMTNGTWSRNPTVVVEEGVVVVEPYKETVPFDDSDLRNLDWCQSGDTIFFAHKSYPPGKLVYSSGSLAYERINFRQAHGRQPVIASVTAKVPEDPEDPGTPGSWPSTGGTKEIEYCVTAVKDGVESEPSVAVSVSYRMPWPDTCGFEIAIDSSTFAAGEFDTFYIYKKESDVFGLIGTTSNNTTFVSISDGFDVGGTLYPANFTPFDKTVHLREGDDNPFASVVKTESHDVVTRKATSKKWSNIADLRPYSFGANPPYYSFVQLVNLVKAKKTSSDTTTGTSYGSTAQKYSGAGATSVTFTLNESGIALSKMRLRIGSLEHVVHKQRTWTETSVVNYKEVMYFDNNHFCGRVDTTSTTKQTKWVGVKSVFTPCPAKWFKATVTYWNASTEGGRTPGWDTKEVSCKAVVDQTSPGEGWTQVSPPTTPPTWERTYGDAEAMWSYNSQADVVRRMDAKAPTVGAVVEFDFKDQDDNPTILTVKQVVINGYTDSSAANGSELVVNGLACYSTGSYVYTFTDNYITPDLTVTPPKTADHFVNPGEYPGCVQIYQQRLVYGSSADNPFTFWMSCTGDLYNFDEHEYVRSSDAITASTAALDMPTINRMLVHRDLMLFSDGGEWQVSTTNGNAVSPSTVAAKLQSVIGCATWVKPVAVDADIIFCDRSGETLYATRYNFASDGYESSNLSVLSQRLFRNNAIVAMAYAQFPESTLECVLDDGTVASLVYMKEHEVCAWSRNVFGGDWRAVDVAANKSTAYGSSSCAFVAKRTYDVQGSGSDSTTTVREWAILGIRDIDPNDTTLLRNLRMDAVRTVTTERSGGAPVQPALGHGEMAVRVGETRTTSGGTTTVTADTYAVGCKFASTLKTTSPEFTQDETAQMEIHNATECEVRVIDGSSFKAVPACVDGSFSTDMAVECPVDETDANFTVTPGDADCRMLLTGSNVRNGSLVLTHDGYLPLTILSISTTYRVEYANHAPQGGGSANG